MARISFAPTGKIDAEIGAYIALLKCHADFESPLKLAFLTFKLIDAALTKSKNAYQYLGTTSSTESGYHVAVKKNYFTQGYWVDIPFWVAITLNITRKTFHGLPWMEQ